MQNSILKTISTSIALIALCLGAARVSAQTPVTIFNYTAPWLYEQGGTNPPANWMTNNYGDASWAVGDGALGFPSGEPLNGTANLTTILSLNAPAGTPRLWTYYFRKKFTLPALPAGTVLTLDCQFDDGGVIYLNGREVARVGMPAAPAAITYTTPASRGGDVNARANDVVSFTPTNLIVGQNVLAVEVHQDALTSSDAVMAMSASYVSPTPISITTQPMGEVTSVGVGVTLSVVATGTTPAYQWQTNNGAGVYVSIPGATGASYVATLNYVGSVSYRVLVSNGASSVTSAVAVVSAVIDGDGPIALSATVLQEAGRTNRIEIIFDETLLSSLVHFPLGNQASIDTLATNGVFKVIMSRSNIVVGISNANYNPGTFPNPGIPPKVTLTMNTTNWHYRSNYYILLNGVRDFPGRNVIAPNSVIGVSWQDNVTTNVVSTNAFWDVQNNPFDFLGGDERIYQQAWQSRTYDPATNGTWFSRQAVVWKDAIDPNSTLCFGSRELNEVGYINFPTLFRNNFSWPVGMSTNVTVKVNYIVNDGVVFYLNGTEIHRFQVTGTGPIDANSTASVAVNSGACGTFTLASTSLVPGNNVLAAAVVQSAGPTDIYFGASLDITANNLIQGVVPTNGSVPRLTLTKLGNNGARISWPTNIYNYALMTTTNVVGPWVQVQTNMANPFTNNPTQGRVRMYRLQRVP